MAAEMKAAFDVERIRAEFPVLHQEVHGKPLVYLDNGATSQKPQAVLDAVMRYYREDNANVHRGVHTLSERATRSYEGARDKVQRFLNAADRREIVFARGTTEAVNLVAQAYARPRLVAGDEILITHMEHHSNIVPWQMVCKQTGARLRVVPINDDGEILFDEYLKLLGPRTRVVAAVHMSNSLGTVNPIRRMAAAAHEAGAAMLVDGAQSAAHMPIDVRELGCDFYAISGHKMFGPTGIGALYGRLELLDAMEPYQGGGDMITRVTFEETTYNQVPAKFEAGTPNIAGAVGLGAAVDYLSGLDFEAVAEHEHDVLAYATQAARSINSLRLIGTASEKAAILSFVFEGVHAHDVGTILDHEGVAIRTGHHCTMPLMQRFGVPATARASFAHYNTRTEVDKLMSGLERVREVFGR